MPEIDIGKQKITLAVDEQAKPLIDDLLSNSNHPHPILAILWRGSGTTENDLVWRWEVMTVNDQWRYLFDYIKYETGGFTFHSTHEDMEFLKSELNKLTIKEASGKLCVQ